MVLLANSVKKEGFSLEEIETETGTETVAMLVDKKVI